MVTGWPSFPTYVSDAAKQEATVVRVPLRDGAMDLEAMAAHRTADAPGLGLHPEQPDRRRIGAGALRRFLDAVDERVLVVVDEAYIEFCEPGSVADAIAEQVRARPNVASLRTFSKLFGLAGMRVGWLAAPATDRRRGRAQPALLRLGGLSAAGGAGEPRQIPPSCAGAGSRTRGCARAAARSRPAGYAWLPSHGNFVAVEVGDADAVAGRLLADGVATRSLSGAGRARAAAGDGRIRGRVARLLELLGDAPDDPACDPLERDATR